MANLLKWIVVMPMMAGIYFYRYAISPLIPCHCRYIPTCSTYGLEALRLHGWRGIGYLIKRLSSCHPLGGRGYDPVPLLPHLQKNTTQHSLLQGDLGAMNNTTSIQSSEQGIK